MFGTLFFPLMWYFDDSLLKNEIIFAVFAAAEKKNREEDHFFVCLLSKLMLVGWFDNFYDHFKTNCRWICSLKYLIVDCFYFISTTIFRCTIF